MPLLQFLTGPTNPKTKAKKERYGLSTFERKLFNDWLAELGIDNSKLSIEQRLKYIQYPGFQFLLQHFRHNKHKSRWNNVVHCIPLEMRVLVVILAIGAALSVLVQYVR